jgi:hypothetical protein
MMSFTLAAPPRSTADRLLAAHRRSRMLAIALLFTSAAWAMIVFRLGFAAPPLLLCLVAAPVIIARPRVGLLSTLAMVTFFESQARFDLLMLPGRYLYVGLSAMGLPGGVISPLELILMLILLPWAVRMGIERRDAFRGGALGKPMLLFALALVAGFVRGVAEGGSAYIGFWECRSLAYIVICYVAAANLIRTPWHLRGVLTVLLFTPSLFAVVGIYRKLYLVDAGIISGDLVFEHDDPIFMGATLLLVAAQQIFGAPRWRRWVGLAFVPIVAFTILATERRAGQIGLAIAFVALLMVLAAVRRRTCMIGVTVLVLGLSIYLPLFWNSSSVLGQPARAVRSLVDPSERDAASNEYRVLEKFNVTATIAANPMLGVGFGREYLFVVPMPEISDWPFLRYEPHHNIFWVWLKLGATGFVIFWVLFGTALARAASLVCTLRDSDTRSFALLALGSIVIVLCYSYVDTGLVSFRIAVFLGVILGTLSVLDRIVEPTVSEHGVSP